MGLAAAPLQALARKQEDSAVRKRKWKHWVWINPNLADEEATLQETYRRYRDAGIRGLFFEADSEKHFRMAKKCRLEAHRWLVVNKRFDAALMAAHPEWYVVNREGVSCIDKPAYVERYRWVCPSREEVRQYLETEVNGILSKDYVDGIHLDCIRYPDVILPVGLWEKYNVDLRQEQASYDYCYCSHCRSLYQQQTGIDPVQIRYPDQSPGWRAFRYRQVTELVSRLTSVARQHRKPITAAVFPTPEIAKRLVRQDWSVWELDGACPMIYHGQYGEPTPWIGTAVAEGIHAVDGKFPLFAGLLTGHFRDAEDFGRGIRAAMDNGARGVTVFGKLDDSFLEALKNSG